MNENAASTLNRISLTPEAQATLLKAIMRKQAALSLRVAVVFLTIIFGLPLVNWLLPTLANTPVGGFTLTWLVLGVLLYPVTWILSGYFIRESDRLEEQIARDYAASTGSV